MKRVCEWIEPHQGVVSKLCGKPATCRLLRWPFLGANDYCEEHGERALRSSINVALVPDAAGLWPEEIWPPKTDVEPS